MSSERERERNVKKDREGNRKKRERGWRGGEKVRGVEKRSEGGRHKCVEERGERRR